MNSLIKRVSITGPESTGKSELSRKLASKYNTLWVPEYAREYILKLGRDYEQKDLAIIGRGQLGEEEQLAAAASRLLFCDTDLIVIKIWSLFKYGTCDEWILERVKDHKYDLYLLCDIDLPWEDDPLREHPDRRQELFNLYIRELDELKVPYHVVSGKGEKRLKSAVDSIEAELGIEP